MWRLTMDNISSGALTVKRLLFIRKTLDRLKYTSWVKKRGQTVTPFNQHQLSKFTAKFESKVQCTQCGKMKDLIVQYSHRKNISSNQLFSNSICTKNVIFTKLSTSIYDLVLIYVCHFHQVLLLLLLQSLFKFDHYRDTRAFILDPCIQGIFALKMDLLYECFALQHPVNT